MRLLMLALISPGKAQLLDKFNAQFLAMRAINPDTHCRVFVKSKSKLTGNYAFTSLYDMSRQQQMEAAANIAHALQPDIIYFRYPYFDEYCHRFVSQCPNTVFEHHALEWTELALEQQKEEKYWGQKILQACAGVVGVTDQIRQYEQQRSGKNLPGLTLSNGIVCDDTPLLSRPPLESELHIAMAAYFSPRHGIDRLIKGIAAYEHADKVHLHLAGRKGPEFKSEEQAFGATAASVGIESQIHYHGLLGPDALRALLESCHLAAGLLAPSRRCLTEVAALKHRTYTFEGIPFFYGGRDSDFPPELDFALRLPDDESPIDMGLLWRFAQQCSKRPDMAQIMRQYAEDNLSWERKSQKLFNFLRTLSEGQTRTKQFCGPLFSCIVLCGQNPEQSKACLASLLAQGALSLEIILAHAPENKMHAEDVQNMFASSEGNLSVLVAQAEAPMDHELRAAGAAAASGQWLWSLSDDLLAAPGFLKEVTGVIEQHPEASLISGEIAFVDEKQRPDRPDKRFLRDLWHRYFQIRPLLVRCKAWHTVHGSKTGAPWRRGEKAFRRKCRRAGLPCIHLKRAMVLAIVSGPLRRLFYLLGIVGKADI